MSLSTTIKSIQDIMRKDVGVDGDAQRIGQLVWLLFLKIWDDREQELELMEDDFASPLVGVTWRENGDVKKADETSCVRCGRCVDQCPLNLVPTKIALAARHGDWDLAARYHIMACMECGCCAYNCPSRIPLVQLIRMGKAQAPRN